MRQNSDGGYRFPLGPLVFQVGQADVLEGWAMDVGQLLPTFTTARPRDHLGNKLAGLWQCNALEVPWVKSRWVKPGTNSDSSTYRIQPLKLLPRMSQDSATNVLGFSHISSSTNG